MIMPSALDDIDLEILHLLQRDALLPKETMAEQLGVSQRSCEERIERLQEQGYIRGLVAVVDYERLGLKTHIFARLRMTRLDEAEQLAFNKAIASAPNILECWPVLGESDCMLKILAVDVAWYQGFVFSVLGKLPGVVGVQSTLTLAAQKNTISAPIGT